MQQFLKVGKEVALSIGPIIAIVVLLHFTLVPLDPQTFWRFIGGSLFVYLGIVFFLIGADLSLVTLGERIGSILPTKGVTLLLIFAFILGAFGVIADPDAQVLADYVNDASQGAIPRGTMMAAVAIGIGFFTLVSVLRVVLQIPLRYIYAVSFAIAFALSFLVEPQFIPIAFDAGGVATGPIIVPFILAFGVGVANVLGTKDRMASSFGMIAMAALGPILGVLILGLLAS